MTTTALTPFPGTIEATPTALVFDPDLDYERWEQIGSTLIRLHRSLPWWIGDWINEGEQRWGERYAQAVDLTGLKAETLMSYASVCRRIPRSDRDQRLSFSAHRSLTGMGREERRSWVKVAVDESLGSKELQARVMGREIPHGIVVSQNGDVAILDAHQGIEPCARAVYHASRMNGGGVYEVPVEPMIELGRALGVVA